MDTPGAGLKSKEMKSLLTAVIRTTIHGSGHRHGEDGTDPDADRSEMGGVRLSKERRTRSAAKDTKSQAGNSRGSSTRDQFQQSFEAKIALYGFNGQRQLRTQYQRTADVRRVRVCRRPRHLLRNPSSCQRGDADSLEPEPGSVIVRCYQGESVGAVQQRTSAEAGGEGPAFDSRMAVETADAEADGEAARAGEWKEECLRQLLTEGQ
jgi:hypothetical protein